MKRIFIGLFAILMLNVFCFAQNSLTKDEFGYDSTKNYSSTNLMGYALYIPAGVTTQALLSQTISSKNAVVGQNIEVILTGDFKYNNQLIAPEGSVISGSIVSNRKAGLGNRNGKTAVKFTTIRTPYNNVIPINAVIATDDNSGILKGGTFKDSAKEYAKDIALGAASGAVAGTIAGAIKDSTGKGALYGAAIGAGAGLVKRAADKGEDVQIPANSMIEILFNQPITLTAQ